MQIFAKALNGRVFTLEVESGDTIKLLKERVGKQNGEEPDLMKLLFEKRIVVVEELQDSATVQECGIAKEAELRIAPQLGGSDNPLVLARRATVIASRAVEEMQDMFLQAHRELDDARSELASRRAALAQRQKKALKDKVKLNVGGQKLTTSRAALCVFPRTRIAMMFSGCYESEFVRDHKGRILLDLDPDCFIEILAFLKTCLAGKQPPLPVGPAGFEATMARLLDSFGITEAVELRDTQIAPLLATAEEGQPPERVVEGDAEPEPEDEGGMLWEQISIEGRLADLQKSLAREREELQTAFRNHHEAVAAFESEQTWMKRFVKCADPALAGSDVVLLEVGGSTITSRRSTLTLCPQSALAKRFLAPDEDPSGGGERGSGSSDSDDDDDNAVVIEEDYYCFRKILNQLRLRAICDGEPPPPAISSDKRDAFDSALAQHFEGHETFILGKTEAPAAAVRMAVKNYWNPDDCHRNIRLSCDNTQVTYGDDTPLENHLVRAKFGYSTGVHYWETQITHFTGAGAGSNFIGVATKDADINSTLPYDCAGPSIWAVTADEAFLLFENGKRRYKWMSGLSKAVRSPLRIGFLLDMDAKTLTLVVDGERSRPISLPRDKEVFPVLGVGCFKPNTYITDFGAVAPALPDGGGAGETAQSMAVVTPSIDELRRCALALAPRSRSQTHTWKGSPVTKIMLENNAVGAQYPAFDKQVFLRFCHHLPAAAATLTEISIIGMQGVPPDVVPSLGDALRQLPKLRHLHANDVLRGEDAAKQDIKSSTRASVYF